MTTAIRPRRSVLYMPGANERAMQKARTLPADCIILDLEDAVAPDAKELAREQVAQAARGGGYAPREVLVRINPLDTDWGEADLAVAAELPVDGIVVPKIESASMVNEVSARVRAAERVIPIWAMLETPLAILRAEQIALNANDLGCLLMGTSDLSKELRLPDNPVAGLMWSLGRALVAARAAGVDIIDGVHLALDDDAGFRAACQRARALGFDGKSLIHPKQIAAANETFGLTTEEVEHAAQVCRAHADALACGRGVAVLNGKLVENLHVEIAEHTLAKARAIAELEAAAETTWTHADRSR
ncbi:MAG: CoA ester lyase [Pseudomonadota bacterium]